MKADVKPATNAEKLVAVIRALGVDKYMQPLAIKTSDLADKTGIAAGSIQASLAPALKRGDVVSCKVTPASGHSYNEWHAGPGIAPPEFKPLNTRRAGIAHGAPSKPLPVTTAAPKVSTPKLDVTQIDVPTLGHAQPAVAKNTGSRTIGKSPTTPSPEAPAVAAKATPEPSKRVRLKTEPAARKASAGDVLRISLDDDGSLLLSNEDGVLELCIDQVLRLGDFMHATEGVWRP